MIRHTEAVAGEGTVVAYKDNASVMVGGRRVRWLPEAADGPSRYAGREGEVHVLMKVETHNHPTAISPFPGAATGCRRRDPRRGRHRPRLAPKAGLTGFAVSNLHLPVLEEPWESEQYGAPAHIASPLEIMLDGPIGAAAFNNEFGRPGLGGFFRVYEQTVDGVRRGYHKPIMSAGGLGTISADMTEKIVFPAGTLLVQLGGPGMRIGMGGGAASSMAAGANAAELDFDSVQRGNPEIERRAQEVINHCWSSGRTTRSSPSTTSAPAGCPTPSPSSSTGPGSGPASTSPPSRSRSPGSRPRRSGATKARSATCWRSPRTRCRFAPDCASVSAARMPSSASPGTTAAWSSPTVATTSPTTTAPSTCRWRCCSASLRG
jgi:hypothetical protein